MQVTLKKLSTTPDCGLFSARNLTVYSDVDLSARLRTRIMMKKKASRPTVFGPDHLPLHIDDLPGVEHSDLSNHFIKKKKARLVKASNRKGDQIRRRAVEGLGLSEGRRFFKS